MRGALKASGLVRHLDPLGRVVLPAEWRKLFDLAAGAPIEMIPGNDGSLLIRRYVPNGTCTFCGETEEIRHFIGRPVCRKCLDQLSTAAGA